MHTLHKQQQFFYPCTINLTNIKFTKKELALLDHGMQYSMQKPLKSYWTNLIMETEKAIKLLDVRIQYAFRIMATRKLRQIYNSNNVNTTHRRQLYILKCLNHKITTENAMITPADNGKTIVIIYNYEYSNKVHTFLSENNFHTIPKNPISKDQKHIQNAIHQCDLIIHKKQNKHIWPVIHNRNTPSYKIVKKLNDILKRCLYLQTTILPLTQQTLPTIWLNLRSTTKIDY